LTVATAPPLRRQVTGERHVPRDFQKTREPPTSLRPGLGHRVVGSSGKTTHVLVPSTRGNVCRPGASDPPSAGEPRRASFRRCSTSNFSAKVTTPHHPVTRAHWKLSQGARRGFSCTLLGGRGHPTLGHFGSFPTAACCTAGPLHTRRGGEVGTCFGEKNSLPSPKTHSSVAVLVSEKKAHCPPPKLTRFRELGTTRKKVEVTGQHKARALPRAKPCLLHTTLPCEHLDSEFLCRRSLPGQTLQPRQD
jgi:hypothetical protein